MSSETLHTFKAGEAVFRRGDQGDALFVVKKGQVEIRAEGCLIELIGPDEFFGEMALIDHLPRSADAIAQTDCEIEAVAEKQFLFRVQQMPYFALKVMKVMALRLRQANARNAG